jgi:hypothetical protein
MSVQSIRRDTASYTGTASKQALIAEAIGCITSGRPYPSHLAAATPCADDCPPTCCEEGIARILGGAAAAPVS